MQTTSPDQIVGPDQPAPEDIILWVGVDWADEKHSLARCQPDGSQGQMHWLEQKPQALDDFFLGLRQKYPQGRIAVVLEQSRGALLYALLKYSFLRLFPVNPRCLSDFRAALRASGAKADPTDAELLREMACKHSQYLREFQLEDGPTRQLTLLTELRRGIVNEQTGLSNQLGAALKCYYPVAQELFGKDLVGAMALAFLKRWPNWSELKKAKPSTLRAFFYAQNCRSDEKIQQRLKIIEAAKPLTEDLAIIQPLELLVQTLIKRLGAVQQSIKAFDARIAEVFASHSKAAVFDSFPGAGPVLAPRLAAAFGTVEANFKDAASMQSWSGVAPVKRQSGKSEIVLFRWARPKFLHQTFIEFARTSVLFSDWAKAFYDEHVAKDWGKFRIYRALAFKWIRIMWRCWKDNLAYDEATYLRALQKRGIKTYAHLQVQSAQTAGE